MGFMLIYLSTTKRHEQVSVKESLRRHGDKSFDKLLSDIGQIEGNDTFDPQMVNKLTHEDEKKT